MKIRFWFSWLYGALLDTFNYRYIDITAVPGLQKRWRTISHPPSKWDYTNLVPYTKVSSKLYMTNSVELDRLVKEGYTND